jgi:hypothetical protein
MVAWYGSEPGTTTTQPVATTNQPTATTAQPAAHSAQQQSSDATAAATGPSGSGAQVKIRPLIFQERESCLQTDARAFSLAV